MPEVIGRYEIRRRIGWGGQGAVFHAYDPHLDLDVALKVLHANVDSADFVERFKVEAQTMVRMTHSNVVRVYDYNPSHPYIVMEYCDGGDLTEILKRRTPLPLAKIVEIILQVLAGVAAAHNQPQPVLHRDLKPGNVLFHQGIAKVADFGLAKVLGADTSLTHTRSLMGTVRYTSPEQCADPSRVDHRTDLWSVGILLCELLTWERPFDLPGDGFMNVAMRIATEEPRPPRAPLPEPLWQMLLRALAKTREDRFSSAAEFAESVREAAKTVDPGGQRLFPDPSVIGDGDQAAQKAAALLDAGQLDQAEEWISRIPSSGGDSTLARYWQRRLGEKQAADDPSATVMTSSTGHSTAAVDSKTVQAPMGSAPATPQPATSQAATSQAAASQPGAPRPRRAPSGGFRRWLIPGLAALALLTVMAVAVAMAPSIFFGKAPVSTHLTTLLVPDGQAPITRATHDGQAVPLLEGLVSSGNPLRVELSPGDYEIEWGAGQRLRFSVPADRTILLVDGLSEQLELTLGALGLNPEENLEVQP